MGCYVYMVCACTSSASGYNVTLNEYHLAELFGFLCPGSNISVHFKKKAFWKIATVICRNMYQFFYCFTPRVLCVGSS